jgi:hypothetical protein
LGTINAPFKVVQKSDRRKIRYKLSGSHEPTRYALQSPDPSIYLAPRAWQGYLVLNPKFYLAVVLLASDMDEFECLHIIRNGLLAVPVETTPLDRHR